MNSAWPVIGLTGFGTLGAAVVADIGDVAVALLVDDRLIGAARLQVVVADEAHVLGLRRIADPFGACADAGNPANRSNPDVALQTET